MLALADEALARGDLRTADERYRRVLAVAPAAAPARVGRGRVALAQGRDAAAREQFEAALAADPESIEAHLGLGRALRRGGEPARARRLVEEGLRLDRWHPELHAERAALTGRAPRAPVRSLAEARERAARHPYDPHAQRRLGELLVEAGEHAAGGLHLEQALWLADLAPGDGLAALRTLQRIDPAWKPRRAIPVTVYADEGLRAAPGWRFAVREVWRNASLSLADLVDGWFVPVAIEPFESAESGIELGSVLAAAAAQHKAPASGLVAAFTAQPVPRLPGVWRRGMAEFLGRWLTVRLEPGERASRVLAHELLHIFGAIHVVDDIDSIMNPSGESLNLDPVNARIVRALRTRGFEGAGFEGDVIERIDLGEAIEAYVSALRVNLRFRELGAARVLEARSASRYSAAREARRILALDPHLADVSRRLAELLYADGRRVDALELLDVAVHLYGPRTRRGRETAAEAARLERSLERRYRR